MGDNYGGIIGYSVDNFAPPLGHINISRAKAGKSIETQTDLRELRETGRA